MAIFHRAWPTGDLSHRSPHLRDARAIDREARRHATRREPARTMMWGLEAGGWSEREAGNLVGLVHGLRPAHSGWSEREIEHLRFLRSLVESGRLEH